VSLAFFFFLLCLSMGLAAWTLFWWSVRSGQLKDPEAVAQEMLDHDDLDGTEPVEASAAERLAARRLTPASGDAR
jgi:cbb3-type cytochrome oxidase maturation protein